MRYIKYSGDWPDPEGIRQQSRELHAKAQRKLRRRRWMGRLSSAAFFLVFLLVFAGLTILIWGYSTEDPILGILETALDIVLTFVALILSFVAGALGATPFATKADKEEK